MLGLVVIKGFITLMDTISFAALINTLTTHYDETLSPIGWV